MPASISSSAGQHRAIVVDEFTHSDVDWANLAYAYVMRITISMSEGVRTELFELTTPAELDGCLRRLRVPSQVPADLLAQVAEMRLRHPGLAYVATLFEWSRGNTLCLDALPAPSQ